MQLMRRKVHCRKQPCYAEMNIAKHRLSTMIKDVLPCGENDPGFQFSTGQRKLRTNNRTRITLPGAEFSYDYLDDIKSIRSSRLAEEKANAVTSDKK